MAASTGTTQQSLITALPHLALHEDTFYAYFRPYRHRDTNANSFGGIGLETYGTDLQIVNSMSPDFVWTVVDGCADDCLYIVPGPHFVNRVVYLISPIAHGYISASFRCGGRPSSLTSLGLRRQMTMLSRRMNKSHESENTEE